MYPGASRTQRGAPGSSKAFAMQRLELTSRKTSSGRRSLAVAVAAVAFFALAPSASAALIEYPVPTVNSGPTGITLGPDGNIWFAEANAGQIARVGGNGGMVEYPLPTTPSQ